jgi:hypothetical protein
MEKRVTKQFSGVRYWRYVFTPILLMALAFGIFMIYADNGPKLPFKEVPSFSFGSVLNSLGKTRPSPL